MKLAATLIAILAFTTFGVTQAEAAQCRAKVLRPVKDDMGNLWKAGQTLPVDIARDDTNGRSFCAHGGSCVPRMTQGSQAVRLTNCKVGAALGGGDLKLVPNASKMGSGPAAQATLQNRTADRLSAMGFSNASAGSFANDYANHPASPNGRLVAQALAGSRTAIAAMRAKLP